MRLLIYFAITVLTGLGLHSGAQGMTIENLEKAVLDRTIDSCDSGNQGENPNLHPPLLCPVVGEVPGDILTQNFEIFEIEGYERVYNFKLEFQNAQLTLRIWVEDEFSLSIDEIKEVLASAGSELGWN